MMQKSSHWHCPVCLVDHLRQGQIVLNDGCLIYRIGKGRKESMVSDLNTNQCWNIVVKREVGVLTSILQLLDQLAVHLNTECGDVAHIVIATDDGKGYQLGAGHIQCVKDSSLVVQPVPS